MVQKYKKVVAKTLATYELVVGRNIGKLDSSEHTQETTRGITGNTIDERQLGVEAARCWLQQEAVNRSAGRGGHGRKPER
jgi:hypothetical protein